MGGRQFKAQCCVRLVRACILPIQFIFINYSNYRGWGLAMWSLSMCSRAVVGRCRIHLLILRSADQGGMTIEVCLFVPSHVLFVLFI